MKYPWQMYHWNIELSAKCTLKCPRCPRQEHEDMPWKNEDITYDTFINSFTPEFIIKNVKRFTFCGTIGDPIYNKEFLKIVRYIKETKPNVHLFIVTNGSHKKEVWWEELATILNEYDSINFGVDGYDQQTNELYRVNSNFDSIMRGMHILGHKSSCFVNWATIYFNFNQQHQDTIRKLAIANNCDAMQWTKSTKFGSKYGEAYGGETDSLEPDPEFISESHRYERYREQLTDRVLLNNEYMDKNKEMFLNIQKEFKDKNILPLCLVGNRGMYISGGGHVHPCSWTGFPYDAMSWGDKTIKFEDSFFSKHREELSIKNAALTEVLDNELWETFFASWQDPKKEWVECNLKCNKQFVDFDYGVGYETD